MKIEQAGAQKAASFDSPGQKQFQGPQAIKKDSWGIHGNDLNISQMSKAEKNALPVSERYLINSIEKANKAVMGADTRFEFSIHEKTKQIIVKVFNADTGDLIREIPSEKILDIVAGIWEAAGLFVDEKR